MYKTALVLSTTPTINVFRSAITAAFAAGHLNHYLICSGFFHERTNSRGTFSASAAFIGARSAFPSGSTVTTVGAYNPASYEYQTFVNALRANLRTVSGAAVHVDARYSRKPYANHWHAKIFIARRQHVPVFAIVGSSNLTRSAFDRAPCNNEADVIIWNEGCPGTKALADRVLLELPSDMQGEAKAPTVFVTRYDRTDPRNSEEGPMSKRLGRLWDDVLAATR